MSNKELSTDCAHVIPKVKYVVIRYGEVMLKGKNRGFFLDQLGRNVRRHLAQFELAAVSIRQGLIWVAFHREESWADVSMAISRVFGLKYAYRAAACAKNMEALEECVRQIISGRCFKSVAIRSKRLDKSFPRSSQEINCHIGAMVQRLSGCAVDLEHPELLIHIDVMNGEIVVMHDPVDCHGGLPLGMSGRVAVLISGGIDSPVAAWRMMKRGCRADFIHFHSAPFTTLESQEKVVELVRLLSAWHGPIELAMVPFGEIQKVVVTRAKPAYRVIIYRRLMMRISERLAAQRQIAALVSGEALGQVASQTLANMATIESVVEIPILRPLIGMDKEEIVDAARKIGTFELSIEPHDDCCNFLMPPRPVTRSTPEELEMVERELDIEALVEKGVRETTWQRVG